MVKLIFTMKRKAGMSREAFKDYYEHSHIPLVMGLLPAPQAYRRNYVAGAEDDPDVITEIVYASEAEAQAAQEAMAAPGIAEQVQADEARFVEPGSLRSYLADPCETAM